MPLQTGSMRTQTMDASAMSRAHELALLLMRRYLRDKM